MTTRILNAWLVNISKLTRDASVPPSVRKFTSELLTHQIADNDCKMIQSALRSLEKLSTSRLVFEPKIALAKQIAGTSEELCSIATSGKRDRVFASYMMSEEPCPKVQKVDHNALLDPVDEFFSGPSTSGGLSNTSGLFSSEIISDVLCNTSNNKDGQISSSTQVSNDLVIIEPSGQTLPYWKQIRGNRLHLAEEGLLEMLKPVLQKKNDKQSLLQNFAQVWINMGKGDVTLFEQYTLLVIHIFINEFTSKRNVLSHPSTTEAMWSTIMSFITRKAIRDGDMEYTWGEIVLDSTARKDGDRDILTLPKASPGHKGDGTGLSSDGRECFPWKYLFYAPHDQDRKKTAEDFYKLLREMRDMLHASKKEKYELGYIIPKEGLCVYGAQCYGYKQNLYEMETCPYSADDVDSEKGLSLQISSIVDFERILTFLRKRFIVNI
ncbi:unnamed protein product [Rhizophagus irregularis]|nr:unnamed protein product [Rhizophagus irregularis]